MAPCLCMWAQCPGALQYLPFLLNKRKQTKCEAKLYTSFEKIKILLLSKDIINFWYANTLYLVHTGDLFIFTWYDRLHVEELRVVHLHLHGPLVQHSNIISKQTSIIMLTNFLHKSTLLQSQHLNISCIKHTCKGCCISRTPFQNYFQHKKVCLFQQPRGSTKEINAHNQSAYRGEVQWKHKVLRMIGALNLSHQYLPALFPGVTLICVLVHREIKSVCIFDTAVWKLNCEDEKHHEQLDDTH